MNWCCLSRADMVDLGVLKKMKRSGCDKVYLGLESGSNEILKIMKKNTTVEKGKNGVELIKKAGIKVAGFFIVGYPEESWETIDQTFKYALELDLDEVSFNVPYPLPGTALFERISTIDMTKDWTIENEIKFVFKSIFDERRIKEKIDRFYKRYHRKKNTKSILSYE
jgi:anaerobic magnesium-protoporphyrin IX monomethyl ester cyclase